MVNLQELDSILITGSNGFVGKSIVENLGKLEKTLLPREIVLVTRQGLTYKVPESLIPLVKVIEQDLLDDWHFKAEPSHVINLAADGSRSPYSKESSDSYVRLNKNLVSWISKHKQPIKIFHASSGACFGHKSLTHGYQFTDPKKLFTEARIEVEELLLELAKEKEISVSIGRLFSFTGNNLLSKNQYAVTKFIKTAISMNRIEVLGQPDTVRSYLHQDSMSEWILRAITLAESDTHLQIGSNEAVTIRQLAEFIAGETGAEIEFSKEPVSGDIYVPDNTKTRLKLGVEEGKSWKDAVLEMIAEARLVSHARD